MPTISVIIPAYNAERTIMQTIESVQQQTFSDFELIVIDDGSSDRTLEVLDQVKDPRLKIFTYKNGGVSVARNRGIVHASGDFISFIDTDDLWTPDKLEAQLAALESSPEAGVAYSWTSFMDEQGQTFHADQPLFFTGNVYPQLLVKNFLKSGSNILVRRQALEFVEFDPALTHGEDWEHSIRLAARTHFVLVPKPQIFYRQTPGSASSKIEVMETDVLWIIEKSFRAAPLELQPLKHQSQANLYQSLSVLYLTRIPEGGGAKQAAQKLQTAIRLYPRILLEKKTQVLVFKLLLIRLLSPKIASYFLQFISKNRAIRMQKSNDKQAVPSS